MGSFKGKAILEIGSANVRLSVIRQEGESCCIAGFAEQPYYGYADGNFLRLDELVPTLKKLLNTLDIRFNITLSDIIVGVPAEFISVVCKEAETDIVDTVTEDDVMRLTEQGNPFAFGRKHVLIETRANYFKTDCNPNRLNNPVGERCSVLKGEISYILCDRYFCLHFEEIAELLGVNFRYVSVSWAEFKMLTECVTTVSRKNFLLVDFGENSTSVTYSSGEGLLFSKGFSIGSENVVKDLTIGLEIPLITAKALSEKLNFNLSAKKDDLYGVTVEEESRSFPVEYSNFIARERIKEIAAFTANIINTSEFSVEKGLPVYLTGSAFCRVRGVTEIFENELKRSVDLIEYNYMGFSDPEYYPLASLIYVYAKGERGNWFSRIQTALRRQFFKLK